MGQVVNIRDSVFGDPTVVYIGRKNARTNWVGSVLANPFSIGKDGDRATVIAKYRQWLWQQIKSNNQEVLQELRRLQALDRDKLQLVCWCKPLPCHGDVVLSCLEWLDTQ